MSRSESLEFLSGHDFSRAAKAATSIWLQPLRFWVLELTPKALPYWTGCLSAVGRIESVGFGIHSMREREN